ncbi:MAG: hypothetical protein HY901_11920 [Deltaproteobacteria bacterium]|nr:hypothetical protein [Deltaproteobacteria bacterium]
MKLWLDDVRPAPPGWVQARTIEEAQRWLVTGEVEEASLDHDLGVEQPDGRALVRWMAQTGHWPKHRPVVHSMNPVGRMYMEGVIERYFGKRPEDA